MALRWYLGSRKILARLLLSVFLIATVNGAVVQNLTLSTTNSTAKPDVALLAGSSGLSTIYTNSTSAYLTGKSYWTYYPGSYNTVSGSFVSGTLPASIQTIDSNYFTFQSPNPSNAYNPSNFVNVGSTTNTSGTIANVASPDGVYLVFNSYQVSTYDYQFAMNESEISVSTASPSWLTRVTKTWTPPTTDNYLIQGNAELFQSANSQSFLARLTVDGVNWANTTRTPAGITNYETVFFSVVVSLTSSSSHTVTLDVATSKAANPINVRNARISAIRVGGSPNYQSVVYNPVNTTTSNSYVNDFTPYTLTPSVAGDNWLIVSYAEVQGSSSSVSVSTNLLIDGVQYHNSTDKAKNGGDWYSTASEKILSLTASTHTLALQYFESAGGATTGSIRNARIYAIDLTALASTYQKIDSDPESISPAGVTTLQTKANLTWTPPAVSDYLIWATGELSSTATTNQITAVLKIDGTVVGNETLTIGATGEYKSFVMRKVMTGLSQASHTILIQYQTASTTQQVKIKNARIFAWRLPVSTQHSIGAEFTGTSNTLSWLSLLWTFKSDFNLASLPIVLQVWNYTANAYPSSGNGYITYTSSSTPSTDQTLSQTISTNPGNFKDSSGNWKMKISVSSVNVQSAFTMKVDWVEYKVSTSTVTASVEYVLTGVNATTPLKLNVTSVGNYNVTSVSVTVQIFNFTASAYPTSGQAYLAYTSSSTSGTDETKILTVTANPSSLVSSGQVKVKVTGSYGVSGFQQKTNLLQLDFVQSITYNYILQIKNSGVSAYNIRLNGNTMTNPGRLGNFTAWFVSPFSTQLQVLSGTYNVQTGPFVSLGAGATIQLAIYINPLQTGTSNVNSLLQIYTPSTNDHIDYTITFLVK